VGDRGGQNISLTYYTHVTKSIFYTFTQSLCHCNKFQSRHNSHTGHCYVISFGAGKRLDVIGERGVRQDKFIFLLISYDTDLNLVIKIQNPEKAEFIHYTNGLWVSCIIAFLTNITLKNIKLSHLAPPTG